MRKTGGLVQQRGEIIEANPTLSDVEGTAGKEANHFIEETVTFIANLIAVLESC